MAGTKKLVLIDGNSLLFRAFYALPLLSTRSGQTTNAVYGFTVMLLKLIEEEKPDMMAVALDSPLPTFRHKQYGEYKATRQRAPDELHSQIPLARQIIEAFRIPIFEVPGYEADDLLGALAKRAESEGFQVLIVTGDLDTLQLASGQTSVMVTGRGVTETVVYDVEGIKKRFDLPPSLLPDYKALTGDPSDNIPGIPGIGSKKAVELLKEFGSLENLLDNLESISDGKIKEALSFYAEQARLSKQLATIHTDVSLEIDLQDCQLKEPNQAKILKLFRELEFKSLLKKWGAEAEIKKELNLKIIQSEEDLKELLNQLREVRGFALDFALSDNKDILGIALAAKPDEAYYIPLQKSSENQKKTNLTADLFAVSAQGEGVPEFELSALKEILEAEEIHKFAHNFKESLIALREKGIRLGGLKFDTMLAAHLLSPGGGARNLEDLTLEYLEQRLPKREEIPNQAAQMFFYHASRAGAIWELRDVLHSQLERDGLIKLFEKVEMPLIEVLTDMELAGVAIDIEHLRGLSGLMGKQIGQLEEEIYRLAGEKFNLNSPKQLQEILFEKLKLPAGKKTKTGRSTSAEILEELAPKYEIAQKIIEYRELAKFKSTYVDALPRLVNPQTQRVHTSLNQTGTATGRLSSSEPNLQNIPVKSEWGKEIRKAFVASELNCALLSADYSQIELRVLAHFSQDKSLMEAFWRDEDIHAHTASEIFGVPREEVTPEMRRKAKVVNFGIAYGMSDFGLAKELNIPQKEAKSYIENYFQRFAGVKEYIERTLEEARQRGYVSTLLGRRRYIPNIHSWDATTRQYAERAAINTPIQGTAADIIKIAMVNIHKLLTEKKLETKMILQVHDELLFEVPEKELMSVCQIVKSAMENAYNLNVPLKVELKRGRNWAEMEEIAM